MTLRSAVERAFEVLTADRTLPIAQRQNPTFRIVLPSTGSTVGQMIQLLKKLEISIDVQIDGGLGGDGRPTSWITGTNGGIVLKNLPLPAAAGAAVLGEEGPPPNAQIDRFTYGFWGVGFKEFNDTGAMVVAFSPLRCEQGKARVDHCEFVNNTSSIGGGGISSSTELIVLDSVFDNNKANDGGAIFSNAGNVGTQEAPVIGLQIVRTTFTDNEAKDGGALSLPNSSWTHVINSSFSSNKAIDGANQTKGGVAWLLPGAKFSAIGTSFEGNSAGMGGAIYSSGGSVILNGGDLTSNTAQYGGAVYDSNGIKMHLVGVTVACNTATGDGGALYLKFTNDGLIENCIFGYNSATRGPIIAYHGILSGRTGTGTIRYDRLNNTGLVDADWIDLSNA